MNYFKLFCLVIVAYFIFFSFLRGLVLLLGAFGFWNADDFNLFVALFVPTIGIAVVLQDYQQKLQASRFRLIINLEPANKFVLLLCFICISLIFVLSITLTDGIDSVPYDVMSFMLFLSLLNWFIFISMFKFSEGIERPHS